MNLRQEDLLATRYRGRGQFHLADLYPLAGVVSIATYLVVECLFG